MAARSGLQTLANQGMLAFDKERQTYSLGLRLVGLAHSAWKQSSLAPVARPFIDALADSVGETVHLAQMTNGQVLYVDGGQRLGWRTPDVQGPE